MKSLKMVLLFAFMGLVTACSGGGGGGTNTYTIGGTLTGLTGFSGVVLQQSGGDDLALSADGSFSFVTPLNDGAAYSVTVLTQPSLPNQICTVSNGNGTVAANNVTNVAVNCPPAITSFELLDPTPGASDFFGTIVVLLDNNNIVVSDPYDSSVAAENGAVHLYNAITQTHIASIYGDAAGDLLGLSSITVLANNNFVIASAGDDEGGIVDAGSVRLVDGATGAPIGTPLTGDTASDFLGSAGITALANNNFVIASRDDDEGGIVDAGSVRLVDGATGVPIGAPLVGDVAGDRLGLSGITVLANNNFVIASKDDDEKGIVDAGSVRLVDGATGAPIGAPITGDVAGDRFGSSGITALGNNNFVIASAGDDEGGIVDVGSVQLVDGATGVQIRARLTGDVAGDRLGLDGITALANNNFVIASASDDEGGIIDAGSVRLVDGATGAPIGAPIVGDTARDYLGSRGITALANNNFVIASSGDDEGGIVDAGSVRLVDGATGLPIGAALTGDVAGDQLGSSGITALANNNFVIASQFDNEGGIVDAGSVRLVDGATGLPIGTALTGDVASDQLGSSGITALANNNFVIASRKDDEGGIVDAGSVRLVDGATGAPIGTPLTGDTASDFLGSAGITALANNNFVIATWEDDEGGIVDAGSVRLVDGTTGLQISSTVTGSVSSDMNEILVIGSTTDNFYILALREADNNSIVDSGLVRLISQNVVRLSGD